MPVNEGPAGTCTNAVNEPGTTDVDTFHLVTVNGYYGGHPNPTRANMANTFSSPPQSPVSVANPVECDWRAAGPERGNITAYVASTNGLTEYTASNFGGALKGDMLSASFDNRIYRAKLNSTGTQLVSGQALFQNVGDTPLDVVAQGDGSVFPGTVWVADIGNGNITVFEPGDYGGSGGGTCAGTDSTTLDEDGDGFTNADEIDNGTSPCSSADVPADRDGDKISDLNDPDDDNDGLPDTSDPFAIDPNNGRTTTTPLRLTWDNDAPLAGGLMNLGFTGLMTNGTSDYESLYDPSLMTAGGAAGVATVDQVSEGDAFASVNTQEYGFQVGLTPPAGSFTAHTRVVGPFQGLTPQGLQSMGLFIGTGHQDNYAKLVVSANGGAGGIEFLKEVGGYPTWRPQAAVALPGPDAIDLYLTIDPAARTVQPSFTVTTAGTTGPRTAVGTPEPIPAGWLSGTAALAAGLISTSNGPAPPFPATWDFFEVIPEAAPSKNLVASPTSVAFAAPQGGASQSANVALSTSDGAAAPYLVTDNATWVTVTPTSGTTPASFMVTVNPAGLAAGTYNAVVTATSTGYSSVAVPVTLSVASTSTYSLVLSASERRENPQLLDGKTVSGNIYVSTTPNTGVRQVRFFIDNVGATGTPYSTDTQSPYDLAGGNPAKAKPFDTRGLPDGHHTITAAVDLTAGGTQLTHAGITVANTAAELVRGGAHAGGARRGRERPHRREALRRRRGKPRHPCVRHDGEDVDEQRPGNPTVPGEPPCGRGRGRQALPLRRSRRRLGGQGPDLRPRDQPVDPGRADALRRRLEFVGGHRQPGVRHWGHRRVLDHLAGRPLHPVDQHLASDRPHAPGPQPRRGRIRRLEDVRLRRARIRQRGRQRRRQRLRYGADLQPCHQHLGVEPRQRIHAQTPPPGERGHGHRCVHQRRVLGHGR